MFRSSVTILLLFVAGASPLIYGDELKSERPLTGKVIILDAGHSVVNFTGRIINPGRESHQGYRENKITLQIADRLGRLLRDEGATVYFTRTWKDFWRQADSTVEDNKCRILFANELKADIFISLHCDWHPSRRFKGISTYYEKDDSRQLGMILHSHLIKSLKASDRKLNRDNYTVLDLAEVPAVLIETGFLSNRTELKLLTKPSYQYDMANAMANGIVEYFAK